MATNWPSGFDDSTDHVPSDPTDELGLSTPTLVESVTNLSDAITGVQLSLGPSPSGTHADVASKLAAAEGAALGTRILEGCEVTPGTGASVNVAAGHVEIAGRPWVVESSTDLAVTPDGSLPRYAIVYGSVLGTFVTLGTPAAKPVVPTPSFTTAIPLAVVYVAAGASSFNSSDIHDFALTASPSRFLRSEFQLVDFDLTQARDKDSTDWEDVINIANWYVSEIAGGGVINFPGFTVTVSGRCYAASGVTWRGANQATSVIKLADNTDLGMSSVRHRCMIESARCSTYLGPAGGEEWHTDNWGGSTDTAGFGQEFHNLTIDGNAANQNVDYEDGSGNYEGGGGIGLYAAAVVLEHVFIRDCVGWGLMSDYGSNAHGPTELDGSGAGSGVPLESRFNNLVFTANCAGSWWFKGPHDGFASSIVFVHHNNQHTAKYCDYGLYAEGGPLQINKTHSWGGGCKIGQFFEDASPGRIYDIVGEGSSEAQVMIHATAGGQFDGLETFTQGNYNQRSLAMAWNNGSTINASVGPGPGGCLVTRVGTPDYGRIRVEGGSGNTITSITVPGLNSGSNILDSSVAWTTSDSNTARLIADEINTSTNDNISAYHGRDSRGLTWVYFDKGDTGSISEDAAITIAQSGGTGFFNDIWWNGDARGWRKDYLAWGFPEAGWGPSNHVELKVKVPDTAAAVHVLTSAIDGVSDPVTFTINDTFSGQDHPPTELDAQAVLLASSGYSSSVGTGVFPIVFETEAGERLRVTDYEWTGSDFSVTASRGFEGTTIAAAASSEEIKRIIAPTMDVIDEDCTGWVWWQKGASASLLDPYQDFDGFERISSTNGKLAFFTEPTGQVQQTIADAGSALSTASTVADVRDVLVDLLAALDGYGLINDTTT